MNESMDPVVVIGAGPIGLISALGLTHYGVPVQVFEQGTELSSDTKAGTILTRTLEVLDRYGAADPVVANSVRIDEIGELDRGTGASRAQVLTSELVDETAFPFVINIPQHELEPLLAESLDAVAPHALHLAHRLSHFTQYDDHVAVHLQTPTGPRTVRASYLLACDGGRSTVRERLGIEVSGHTLEERYMLIDLVCDLDVANPRDYPYLAYFGDPVEWMILVRQPHCWRFLFPLAADAPEPSESELLARARHFIGEVSDIEVLGTNIYTVHHRVAETWQDGRIFLLGDAAHLITPMWALGLNTGVLDASNLPWRLAWVLRGWADPSLLAEYEREQAPVAIQGSGEMAEAARSAMARVSGPADMGEGRWGNAYTRTLLGVRLDVEGSGDWSMVRTGDVPDPVRVGDRAPDLAVFGLNGATRLHRLVSDSFVALHFADARHRPQLPDDQPGLVHFVISRWDAPHNSGSRHRSLFDPGERARQRFAVDDGTVVLLRPDAHVAAILTDSADVDVAGDAYRAIVRPSVRLELDVELAL